MSRPFPIADAVHEILGEWAEGRHNPFNSAHEGFAALKEEVDELWVEVKRRGAARNKEAMRREAKQVAAMALRFMIDVTP